MRNLHYYTDPIARYINYYAPAAKAALSATVPVAYTLSALGKDLERWEKKEDAKEKIREELKRQRPAIAAPEPEIPEPEIPEPEIPETTFSTNVYTDLSALVEEEAEKKMTDFLNKQEQIRRLEKDIEGVRKNIAFYQRYTTIPKIPSATRRQLEEFGGKADVMAALTNHLIGIVMKEAEIPDLPEGIKNKNTLKFATMVIGILRSPATIQDRLKSGLLVPKPINNLVAFSKEHVKGLRGTLERLEKELKKVKASQ